MTFGQRLKAYRKEKGLSQDKLASIMYVTRQSVSQWENDKTMPSVDLLLKLSEVFGVSVDVLLGKDEEKTERVPFASAKIITDKKRLAQCRDHILLSSAVIFLTVCFGLFLYIFLQTSIYPKALDEIRFNFDYTWFWVIGSICTVLFAVACSFFIYRNIIFRADLKYYSMLSETPVIEFYDDCFSISDGSDSPLSINYHNIKRIFETDNFIIIYTGNNRRIYFDKQEADGDTDKLFHVLRGCKKYSRKLLVFRGKRNIGEKAAKAVVCVSNILFVLSLFTVEYELLLKVRIMTDPDIAYIMKWIMIISQYAVAAAALIFGLVLIVRKIKAVRIVIVGAVMLAAIPFFNVNRLPFYTFQQHRVMPDEFVSYMEKRNMEVKATNQGRTERLLMDCYTATSKDYGFDIVYYNFNDEMEQDGHVYAAELYNKCVTDTKMFARKTINSNHLDLKFNSYYSAESEDKYCYVSLNKYSVIYIFTDAENKDNVGKVLDGYKMPLPY